MFDQFDLLKKLSEIYVSIFFLQLTTLFACSTNELGLRGSPKYCFALMVREPPNKKITSPPPPPPLELSGHISSGIFSSFKKSSFFLVVVRPPI